MRKQCNFVRHIDWALCVFYRRHLIYSYQEAKPLRVYIPQRGAPQLDRAMRGRPAFRRRDRSATTAAMICEMCEHCIIYVYRARAETTHLTSLGRRRCGFLIL